MRGRSEWWGGTEEDEGQHYTGRDIGRERQGVGDTETEIGRVDVEIVQEMEGMKTWEERQRRRNRQVWRVRQPETERQKHGETEILGEKHRDTET